MLADYSASFYVGDAAGRSEDHADTDRSASSSFAPCLPLAPHEARAHVPLTVAEFALNADLTFLTPERFFLGQAVDRDYELWGWHPHGYDHARASLSRSRLSQILPVLT